MASVEQVVERERDFHDARYEEDQRAGVNGWYAVTVDSSARRLYERSTPDHLGGEVLELGCGPGSTGWHLALDGHQVHGIDISERAVEEARAHAEALGVANASFDQMDAHALDLADDSADIVTGAGILHHLDLALAIPEIARVLRPDGRAVFYEPMAHNPLIRLFRRFTPGLRTEDEHPLTTDDLTMLGRFFEHVEVTHFHLVSFVAAPLVRMPGGAVAMRAIDRVDHLVMKVVPALRKYCWIAVIELTGPSAAV
jgi:SAM-dependent methyltransferase